MSKKSADKSIKIGLAGCGRISSQHLSAIRLLKGRIKLMAVCDTDPKRARQTALKHRVPFYTDYRDLLKRKDIDLVVVCTPSGLHCPIGLAGARAGKHVLLEKPLALNLKDGQRLIKTFRQKKKALMTVMQVRYNPALVALKKAVEKGKLGKIYSATLTLRWSRPQSYFEQADWRGKKSLDGGILLNQGIHYIDALLWLLGEVSAVYGKADRVAHNNIETEDQVFSLLKFKNRAYGLIEATLNAYPRNLECSIAILGEKGTVKLGGRAINEIEFWEAKNCPKPKIQEKIIPGFAGVSPNHFFVYQDILDYLQKKKKPFFSGEEALKSIEVIEAIYQSARKNKEIKL